MPATTTPYTHEMVMVHRVFRRNAAQLQHLVAGVTPGDAHRARRLAGGFREYAAGLHHHHALEDELIWPRLHARATEHSDLISTMSRQHERLDETLAAVQELLPDWEEQAAEATGGALAVALGQHCTVLVEHLDDEESKVLPLVAQYLTVSEWNEVGRRGLETLPRNKVMIALGAILQEADEQERRYFLSKVPAPGRLLWHLVGKRQYRRYVTGLRGTAER